MHTQCQSQTVQSPVSDRGDKSDKQIQNPGWSWKVPTDCGACEPLVVRAESTERGRAEQFSVARFVIKPGWSLVQLSGLAVVNQGSPS